ncbi:MAG: sugar ABC transporter permease [Ruminococcaceae bacterium]|jgi:raffinose/stachyose/melibiose transport system permease protein|nr:sugar ABC transporter permease [Oscillospiraceae bacterium]
MQLNRRDSILLLVPATLLYAVFVVLPVFVGFYYSFSDLSGIQSVLHFVGFDNYLRVVQDSRFWNSFQNTVIFTLIYAVLSNLLGLVIALLLELRMSRIYKNTMRVLFYLPAVLTPVVVGYIWYYLYKVGIPEFFSTIGLVDIAKFEFIGTSSALYATAFVTVWMQTGTAMIIFIAGLSNIPNELHEAAHIDGATQFQIFRHISIPMVSYSFMINLILSIINGFKQFDQIFTMTKGGPGKSTETVSLLIYSKGFQAGDMSYACTVSFFLLVVVMLISTMIIRYFREGGEQV